MTGFRADRSRTGAARRTCRLVAAAAVAAGLGLGAPVAGAPSPGPAATESGSGPDSAGRRGILVAPPVDVRDLGAMDVDALGSLTLAAGGFGRDAWAGLDRRGAGDLLEALPAAIRSPVLRDLTVRLLLTAARPREAGGAEEGAGVDEGAAADASFLAERARALSAIGADDAVLELADSLPTGTVAPAFRRIEVDARFLNGDLAQACRLTATALAAPAPGTPAEPEPFWQRALAFCQALAGEHASAGLTLALLAETGQDDPQFASLIGAMAGRPATLDTLAEPAPLILAMARAAGVRLPTDAAETDDPAVLAAVAAASNAALETRLAAAEPAFAAGALDVEVLGTLYANAAAAHRQADAVAPAIRRAHAFRTALVAEESPARANAVVAALAEARAAGQWLAAAALFRNLVIDLEPQPALLARSPELLRVAAATGAAETAGAWLALVDAEADTNSAALVAATAMTPVVHLLSDLTAAPWDLDRWLARLAERPEAVDHGRWMAALLRGLGTPLPLALASAAQAPATPDRAALMASAEAGQGGKTLLQAIALLGAGGPEAADPADLGVIVAALRTIGFAGEARALAVEAAAAVGL